MTKGKTLIELIGRCPREPRDWYRITKFSVIIHPLGFVKKLRQDLTSKINISYLLLTFFSDFACCTGCKIATLPAAPKDRLSNSLVIPRGSNPFLLALAAMPLPSLTSDISNSANGGV